MKEYGADCDVTQSPVGGRLHTAVEVLPIALPAFIPLTSFGRTG